MLMVLLKSTGTLPCLFLPYFCKYLPIFCFQFLFLVRNGEPLFRYQLQYLLIVYTWIWETYISKCYKLFVLVLVRPSVNLCSIYLAEIIRTFKVRFSIKCTGEGCGASAITFNYFSETFALSVVCALSVTVTERPDFAVSLKDFVPVRNCL